MTMRLGGVTVAAIGAVSALVRLAPHAVAYSALGGAMRAIPAFLPPELH